MSRLDDLAAKTPTTEKTDLSYLLEDDDRPKTPPVVRISLRGIPISELVVFFFKCAVAGLPFLFAFIVLAVVLGWIK